MNIEELKQMLSTFDMERIGKMLEERGFRQSNIYSVKEFELSLFRNAKPDEVVECEDEQNDFKYIATLYRQIKGYEGITFVEVVAWKIYRTGKCPMTPRKHLFYTDAPINQKYERDQESLTKCGFCKRKYKKKELIGWDEKLFCERCMAIVALSEAAFIDIDDD